MDAISRLVQSPFLQDNLTRIWLTQWVAVLLATLAGVSVARSAFSSAPAPTTRERRTLPRGATLTPGSARVVLAMFSVFLAAYVFALAYKVDFALYDNDIFTEHVLRGRFYPPPVWPAQGRFFPLGHQEWNLLAIFTQSTVAYFALPLVELLVVVLLLYCALRHSHLGVFFLGAVLVLTAPSVARAFSSPSFPERNLVALMLAFVLAVRAYARAPSALRAAFVLVVVHCTLYYKEPAFVIFGVFSGMRVIHAFLTTRRLGVWTAGAFARTHALDLAILLLCAVFLLSYAVVYLSARSLGYAVTRTIGSREALLYYLREDTLLWVFLAVGAGRLVLHIRKRQVPDTFWDYLAAGAFGYFAFFVAIGLASDYFLAPLHVVAVLYAIGTLHPLWRRPWRPLIAALIAVCVVQNASVTSDLFVSRLNLIEARTQMLRFLLDRSRRTGEESMRLHFPFARERYVLYYLSCFFKYKAPRTDVTNADEGQQPVELVFTSPLEFPGDVCVPWNRDHQCFQSGAARAGDLTVVLPEDVVPEGYLSDRRQRGQVLFEYQPLPAGAGTHAYVFED